MDPSGYQPYEDLSFEEEEQDAHNYRLKSIWSDDSPWHHLAAMLPNPVPDHPGVVYNTHEPQFQVYQSHPSISDCGTFPHDSAYGSGPTVVESAPSIFDGDLESRFDPSLLDQNRAQIDQLCGGFRVSLGDSSPHEPPVQRIPVRVRAETKLHCQHCKTDLKTKAQLNKHIQRHGKPHVCPHQGCKRSGKGCGFGTPNDLLRHRRTVHKEIDLVGAPFYVCTHEPCISKKLQKKWPRADNFRSHLGRQHAEHFKTDDDLQRYVYVTQPEERRSDLHGVGQGIGPVEIDISGISPLLEGEQAFPDDHLSTSIPQGPTMALPVPSGQVSAYDDWPQSLVDLVMNARPVAAGEVYTAKFAGLLDDGDFSTEIFSETLESPAIFQDDMSLGDMLAIEDGSDGGGLDIGAWATAEPSFIGAPLEFDEVGSEKSEHDETTEETDLTADVLERTLIEAQPNSSRIIEILQSLPPQLLQTALNRDRGFGEGDSKVDEGETFVGDTEPRQTCQRANYQCPECPKAFSRQCELKKHSKRHAKPYGCTFRDCDKTFGSKNDWKRHESNQHSTLETWTCDMPDCRVVRHRQEIFRSHLLRDHHLAHQPKLVEEKLERCRTGRPCDPRFWCGFCVEVVELERPVINAWKKRCDHIDNHLWGKEGLSKKEMADWVFIPDGRGSADGVEGRPAHSAQKRKATDMLERPRHKKQKEDPVMWYFPSVLDFARTSPTRPILQ